MKIIYNQNNSSCGALRRFGVENCYFKMLIPDRDRRSITKKSHHHTGYEMHIVINGSQEYEVGGTKYKLGSGDFLLICPQVPHTVVDALPNTQKYSIAFNKQTDAQDGCFFGALSERMYESIDFIISEASLKKEISPTLIENAILEILVLAFRMYGVKERQSISKQLDENEIVSLAKQYIEDNIEAAPSVADVSEYCCLSTKQLTRLFNRFEELSPGDYIINKRVKKIEELLSGDSLSLKQISTVMNFDNEYYFNAFFKKYYGMPPGEYRKMLGK